MASADLWSDDFSYGFRPGKSAHDALDRIKSEGWKIKDMYIIDMDISKYANLWFDDTIPQDKLRETMGRGVSDGVLVETSFPRIIRKWLNAGVMERGDVRYNTVCG